MTNSARVVSGEQALKVIHDHNALVKIVKIVKIIKIIKTINPAMEPPFADPENSWGFLLSQLKDPENCRPCRALPDSVDRTRYFNPQTGEWLSREVSLTRGQRKKGASFTKKTATTLVPPNGRIKLYRQTHGVGILFDVNKCYLGKYIFDNNIVSDEKWWIHGVKPTGQSLPRSVSLDAIRDQQRKAEEEGVILKHNEILAKLSAYAVVGIVVPENDLLRRLNAQYRRLILRNVLNVDVPILIMTSDTPVHKYTETEKYRDLLEAASCRIDMKKRLGN
ncbi:MAG: hypothetical protein NTZ67_01425 [Gammaproteobacteria bacterium]|nr:hypothetical protein [Gammaproteobacteria bacterium]